MRRRFLIPQKFMSFVNNYKQCNCPQKSKIDDLGEHLGNCQKTKQNSVQLRHKAITNVCGEAIKLSGGGQIFKEAPLDPIDGINKVFRMDLTCVPNDGKVRHFDVTVGTITAKSYMRKPNNSKGTSYTKNGLMKLKHKQKLRHYERLFGKSGKNLAGAIFMPLTMDSAGNFGQGFDYFFDFLDDLRENEGKPRSSRIRQYWRGRLSVAFHTAVAKGTRNRFEEFAKEKRIYG